MKVLVVKYLPRGERSHTRQLLDATLEGIQSANVETLDLLEDTPDLFDEQRVMAYIHRNYLDQELTVEQAASLAKMDRMTQQLVDADVVILATPMYNFSLPAMVKAWFDSVMLKGDTWDADASGYKGLLDGKKGLILMSSGGAYDGMMEMWEHAMSLAKTEFSFMGFGDVRSVWVQGVNMSPDDLEERKRELFVQAKEIVAEWKL